MKQTKLRTNKIDVNNNISFPIGTIKTVQKYYKKLYFSDIFTKYKKKGRNFNRLIEALVAYKLAENLSISKASDWINRKDVLEEFSLNSFEERTLFRVLEILGKNREEIIADIQDILFDTYDFEHTDINMDWSSLILWGTKSKLGKYGYSRDHRPDKKQITIGLSELANPINIPIGLTINPGNINDQKHFADTYNQTKKHAKIGSLYTFDKGANGKDNLNMILRDKMKYLTAKKLNKSDDKLIKAFDKSKAELVNTKDGIYGIKRKFPNRYNFFYFSEKLQKENIASALRKAERKLKEAQEIQNAAKKGKSLPKRFRVNNILVDVIIEYQTKLNELSETEAFELVKKASITGREGFFCLTSSENLTLEQALETYRKKDSIEKIFYSLKNEIVIKPLRVWSTNNIYGALILGFIAQLFISLIKYDYKKLKKTSSKFIKISLSNLTVTIENRKNGSKRRIYSNFDPINSLICLQNQTIT